MPDTSRVTIFGAVYAQYPKIPLRPNLIAVTDQAEVPSRCRPHSTRMPVDFPPCTT